jgi:RHS repeat-associated protein
VIAGYQYRGLRLSKATYANQCTAEFSYDGAGRSISGKHSSAGGAFLEMQQLFDGGGNRRFQLDIPAVPAPHGGEVYEFDSLYRLTGYVRAPLPAFNPTQFEPPNAPQAAAALVGQQAIDTVIGHMSQNVPNSTYQYDAAGNRLQEHLQGQPPKIYVPNSLNEYSTAGGVQFQYDLNGNLLDDGNLLYRYNYRNQLIQAVQKATNTELLRLSYDATGRLIVFNEGGQTSFLISDGLNVVEEYRGGVVASQYIHEGGVDRRCQSAGGAQERWYHRDLLGSTRQLTDSNGQPLAARYEYEPFGALVGGPIAQSPYLFTGKRYFPLVNIYDSRARQYSPSLGRFLQRDPKGFATGPNLFTYAGSNPVGYVDALGLDRSSVAAPDNAARELRGSSPSDDGPSILALSKEDWAKLEEDKILTLDLDPDVAFPVTPEARWPYAFAHHVKHGIYKPLRSLFSDRTGIGKEREYYLGYEGTVKEWTEPKDHADALGALFEIGTYFLPTKEPEFFVTVALEEGVGVVTVKMAQSPSEVFGVLSKFRDEELASMRSLYPELLGPGGVDPALALGGANKGTWFGNILNERVRQRAATAISEGTLSPQLQWTRQGQQGIDFWLPQGTGYDLFPARGNYLIQHEASYVGQAAPDGTIIQELFPLLYHR